VIENPAKTQTEQSEQDADEMEAVQEEAAEEREEDRGYQ